MLPTITPAPAGTAVAAPAPNKQYLPVLTGVRALAAYLVFFHHCVGFKARPGLEWLLPFREEGYVGVSIFFVLSGFLIALRYFDSAQLNAAWWRKYIVNRVARIYPMYFLVTVLTLAVRAWHSGSVDWVNAFMSLTFLKGLFEDYAFRVFPQGWTLAVEESFYFTAPVAFWLVRNHRFRLWLQPVLILGVGLLLMSLLSPLNWHGLLGFPGNYRFIVLYTFFGRATEFYIGIQLARWYQTRPVWRLPVPGILTAVGVALVIGVILSLSAVRGTYNGGYEAPAGMVINNVVMPLAVAVLFYGLITERTWLQRFFASGPLQVLGKSSYVFYLIHMGVISSLFESYGMFRFVLLLLTSLALYYGAEEPAHRWLRRTFGGGR